MIVKPLPVFLGGGNSSIFYVHPEPWGNYPNLTNIFQMIVKPLPVFL